MPAGAFRLVVLAGMLLAVPATSGSLPTAEAGGLAARVEALLSNSQDLSLERVRATSSDDTVTLSGIVESWEEAGIAVELAGAAGAEYVVNLLQVVPAASAVQAPRSPSAPPCRSPWYIESCGAP
jgi:hypothetical protein